MAKRRPVTVRIGSAGAGNWGGAIEHNSKFAARLRLISRPKPIRKLITKEALMSLISNSLKTRGLSLCFVI